ncbi:hypothetical protein BJV74DRAFT_114170 [Russula compacta]|nr:hypothetical protein BJV74DRAFT_114170 [Russula compacta]
MYVPKSSGWPNFGDCQPLSERIRMVFHHESITAPFLVYCPGREGVSRPLVCASLSLDHVVCSCPPNVTEIAAPTLLGDVWNWALYGVLVVQMCIATTFQTTGDSSKY